MKQNSLTRITYRLFRFLEELLNRLLLLLAYVWLRQSAYDQPVVLLAKLDSIGDFVMFTASLSSYREHFRNHKIVLLVTTVCYQVAKMCPYVDEVWCVDQREFRVSVIERLKWFSKIAHKKFDVAINAMYSTTFSNFDCLIGWTNAPRRIAYQCLDKPASRTNAGPYFTELVPTSTEWKWEIDRNNDLLAYLGYSGKYNTTPEVWLSEFDIQRAHEAKNGFGLTNYGVLFPGARIAFKKWSADNFVEAVQGINKYVTLPWVLCGSVDEYDECQYIVEKLLNSSVEAYNIAGKTDLQALSIVIRDAEFCLANDTAAIHIAAAFDIPTVCILGGGHYGRFYPYPGNPLTVAVTNRLPCYNCHWNCILDEVECVTKIRVEDVVTAATHLLKKRYAIFEVSRDTRAIAH